ncbi:hypothetical protein D3C78_835390 [compost metagenome]
MSQEQEQYNVFYPAISVGDSSVTFGEGKRIGITMADVAEIVKVSENLATLPELTIVRRENKPVVKMGKVIVGALIWPPVEELANWKAWEDSFVIGAPDWLKKACVDEPLPGCVTQGQVEEWLNVMREKLMEMNPSDETLMYFDSLTEIVPNLNKVGKTHVIVPDANNMTEDMIDASRSLLLFGDSYDHMNAEKIREKMALRPWWARNMPDWFKEYKGHLTKAGRASLAYALTVAAATNPPAPEEAYFLPEGHRPKASIKDHYYGMELILRFQDKELRIEKAYESFWDRSKDGDTFDLQINRHQLPDFWKSFFKKDAIEVSGIIAKEGDVITLVNPRTRLGLKTDYAEQVGYNLNPSIKIEKKARR